MKIAPEINYHLLSLRRFIKIFPSYTTLFPVFKTSLVYRVKRARENVQDKFIKAVNNIKTV